MIANVESSSPANRINRARCSAVTRRNAINSSGELNHIGTDKSEKCRKVKLLNGNVGLTDLYIPTYIKVCA